jgi:hypothetical protein
MSGTIPPDEIIRSVRNIVQVLVDKILGISDGIDSATNDISAGLAEIANGVDTLVNSIAEIESFHVDMVPHVWVHRNNTNPESWTVWIGEARDHTFKTKDEAEAARHAIHREIMEHWDATR